MVLKHESAHVAPCVSSAFILLVVLVGTTALRRGYPWASQVHSHIITNLFKSEVKRTCLLVQTEYASSRLEMIWMQNISQWELSDYCVHARRFETQAYKWVDDVLMHAASPSTDEMDADVFSSFTHTYDCGGDIKQHTSWIEPLAFGLRHPNAFCSDTAVDDRDYMLVATQADVEREADRSCSKRPCKTMMFDVDPNRRSLKFAEPGILWFLKVYHEHGIDFNQYMTWNSTDVLSNLRSRLPHWFWAIDYKRVEENSLATSAELGPWHPLGTMQATAQPGDFVVLKLSVDNITVSRKIIKSIDASILGLIDELFYGERVIDPCELDNSTENIADAYAFFHELRKRGVRAHAWV